MIEIFSDDEKVFVKAEGSCIDLAGEMVCIIHETFNQISEKSKISGLLFQDMIKRTIDFAFITEDELEEQVKQYKSVKDENARKVKDKYGISTSLQTIKDLEKILNELKED